MPASEQLLILFITARGASHVADSTMKHWLLGLQLWHSVNNAPWHGACALSRAVKSVGLLTSMSSHCSPHAHVTINHLHILLEHLDFNDPFDSAVFAIACVAFWSQSCLGKLTFDGPFDALQHAMQHGIKLSVASSRRRFRKIWLPQTKTKPHSDWLMFTDSGCSCSAYLALLSHLTLNLSIPPVGL